LAACDKLKARVPEPQIWLVKVATRYLHRLGGRALCAARYLAKPEIDLPTAL
jgi:hypothetical protein